MLKQEIRRVLHSPFFYVSIIILVFADFPVMLDQFEMSNELTYLVDVGWGMGYGSVLYPLLCVLTTAESYLMEYRSGYRYSSMSRTSKTRYAVTKMAVAIGTGAAIAVLSRLLFLGLTALIVYKIHGQVLVGSNESYILAGDTEKICAVSDVIHFGRQPLCLDITGDCIDCFVVCKKSVCGDVVFLHLL